MKVLVLAIILFSPMFLLAGKVSQQLKNLEYFYSNVEEIAQSTSTSRAK
jgi:hypothetical protein